MAALFVCGERECPTAGLFEPDTLQARKILERIFFDLRRTTTATNATIRGDKGPIGAEWSGVCGSATAATKA
jgi:hypothetical protein